MDPKKIVRGITAGVIATTICWPLDTIKIQNQVRIHSKGVIPAFRHAINQNGIRGLYRGLSSGNLAVGFFYGLFFPTYDYNKVLFAKYIGNEHIVHCLSSYSAGIIASTIVNPFFVTKIRHQSNLTKNYTIYQTMKTIYCNEGLSAFYKGLNITYIKNIELGLQLTIFEFLRKKFDQYDISIGLSCFIASFIGKSISTSITYPLDTIRTISRTGKQLNMFGIIKSIYSNTGLIGFYKGYLANSIRSVPCSVIALCVNDIMKRIFEKK